MPNHVYYHLALSELTDEQENKLHEIAKVGLCQYYRPMAEEIRNTTSPTRIVSETEYKKIMKENEKIDRTQDFYYEPKPITKKMQAKLLEKYGVDNWYDWAYENWGTKWGCYQNEIDGQTLTFTTAWGLFNTDILEEFAHDFPDFTLCYEEEQGWGGEIVFEDGAFTCRTYYDAPQWSDVTIDSEEGQICELLTDIPESHFNEGAGAGYYYDWDINCPVPQEVLNELI